jgi:uncharacterized protein YjcR
VTLLTEGNALTEGEVLAICAFADKGAKVSELAFEYGVSTMTIRRILSGERWGKLTGRGTDPRRAGGPRRMGNGLTTLTDEDVMAIYTSPGAQKDIARDFCVSRSTVCNIKRGHSWNVVTGHERTRTHTKAGS